MEEWRPDWLDESAYDFLSGASWEMWAWQFLRRNSAYQDDWDSFVTDCHLRRIDNCLTPLSKKLGEQWCLTEMVDPSADSADGRWLVRRFAKRLTKAHTRPNSEYLDLKVREKQAFGFDLTKPISPQVKAVKEDLLELQKCLKDEGLLVPNSPGKNTGDLGLYLRILDATAAGISREVIVATIEPYKSIAEDGSAKELDTLSDNLKAARSYVKSRYQKLLLRLPKE